MEAELTLLWQAIRAIAAGVHRTGGIDEVTHNLIAAASYAHDRDVKAAEEQAAKAPLSPAEATELQRLLARYTAGQEQQQAAPAPAAQSTGAQAFFSGQQPVQAAGTGLPADDPNYVAPRTIAANPTVDGA